MGKNGRSEPHHDTAVSGETVEHLSNTKQIRIDRLIVCDANLIVLQLNKRIITHVSLDPANRVEIATK